MSWFNRRALTGRSRPPSSLSAAEAVGSVARLDAAAALLVDSLVDGTMSETAYDTALVSRLREPSDPRQLAFPGSLFWLRRFQHPDGSWGGRIETAHDRIVSTLAAVVRLADVPEDWARLAARRGLAYLGHHAPGWEDGPHETIAFELIVPALLRDARALGLELPFAAFARLEALRDEKLQGIPRERLYAEPTTLVHSLEFLGRDIDQRRVRGLRAPNGSYGNSPSATAHVLTQGGDEEAERYLRRVMRVSVNGGACTVYPFEVFEKAWVLHNLDLAGLATHSARPHREYLRRALGATGVGSSIEGIVPDADDTAVVLLVLRRSGYAADLGVLRRYERDACFACFPFERTTSISANAHVLEALREEPGRHARQRAKIVSYLRDRRLDGRYWQDKWHLSTYYATSLVVLAARDVAHDLIAPARGWLLETQRADGSWGRYCGNSEETAYAMQALLALAFDDAPAAAEALARGAAYLARRFDDTDYPELWVGKGLYTPYAVVRSAVISALRMYARRLSVRRKGRATPQGARRAARDGRWDP